MEDTFYLQDYNKNLYLIQENMKKNYMSDVYNIIETQIKEII